MAVISLAGSISNLQAFLAVGVQNASTYSAQPNVVRDAERAQVIDIKSAVVGSDESASSEQARRQAQAQAEARAGLAARSESAGAEGQSTSGGRRESARTSTSYETSEFTYTPPQAGRAPSFTSSPVARGQYVDVIV